MRAPPAEAIGNVDAVVNLAGEPVVAPRCRPKGRSLREGLCQRMRRRPQHRARRTEGADAAKLNVESGGLETALVRSQEQVQSARRGALRRQ